MKQIIEVKHLSKRYAIGKEKKMYNSLRDDIVEFFKHPLQNLFQTKESFWPLKKVSFSVDSGVTIGIIGSNGAGKSTLLKILSRVTSISEGEVILRGRVGSLLEVGTGFHPELTGRENIYLNGSVMGLSRKEINEKFESIVAFSGTEKFLETPIKHYSSGMFTRLAFSVAAHLDPDILLVDEVLSVGDLSFQEKAMEKINKIGKEGKTVIFVSHNMEAISKICKKVLWLEKGKIVMFDDASKVIAAYILNARKNAFSKSISDLSHYERDLGYDQFRFVRVGVKPPKKHKQVSFSVPFEIEIEGEALKDLKDFIVEFSIATPTGVHIFTSNSKEGGVKTVFKKGKLLLSVVVDPNLLLPGSYILNLIAYGTGISLLVRDALVFDIVEGHSSKTTKLRSEGLISYPLSWRAR